MARGPHPAGQVTTPNNRPDDGRRAIRAAALAYAARGWRVIALHNPITIAGTDQIACSCFRRDECRTPGKHPRFAQWRQVATTDPDTIRTWWRHFPHANIGIATGGLAGLVVVDIDGQEGRDSLAKLVAEHGELPVTLRQSTGRAEGGTHYVFQVEVGYLDWFRNRAKIAPGIDIRAEGGLIVAAPSLHPSGVRYAWVDPDAPIAPLPNWLGTLTRSPAGRLAPSVSATPSVARPDESRLPSVEECTARATAYIARRPPAIAGQGGHAALFAVALDVVRGFAIDPDDAIDLIDEHYSPRCDPPWSHDEVRHKVRDAYASTQVGWAYLCGFVGDAADRSSLGGAAGDATVPDGSVPDGSDSDDVIAAFSSTAGASGSDRGGTSASWRASATSADSSVTYGGARVVEVIAGATVRFEVLDGPHRGRRIRLPLDWPVTARSRARWDALAKAVGVGVVSDPSSVLGHQLRVELVTHGDGLRVGRFFAARRTPAAATTPWKMPRNLEAGVATGVVLDQTLAAVDATSMGDLDLDDERSSWWQLELDPPDEEGEP